MTLEELRPLKQALLDSYGHFADHRIKKIDSGRLFIIDDRTNADHGADGKLYAWFCLIFADVVSPNSLKITMRGGVPQSSGISAWIKSNNAKTSEHGLEFLVTNGNVSKLTSLAKVVQSMVRPGARYSVKAYKYVCPRTAKSLERLYSVLVAHWQS